MAYSISTDEKIQGCERLVESILVTCGTVIRPLCHGLMGSMFFLAVHKVMVFCIISSALVW